MGTHEAAEAVKLENLTKVFGKLTAVENLSLNVAPGEVLGFLGPNGAGKTTVMRMLIGLLKPTGGAASILGFDIEKRDPAMLARIGYLPGTLRLYENLTSQEFLHFIAKMRKRNCDAQIADLAERLQLDLRRHIHDLSKGNLQKVGVIAAFMHNPDVLILDEPTSGLDPLMQREFEGMLDEAKKRGAATLLSSHVMSEAETLATRIAIINQGKLLMLDDMAKLKLKTLKRVEFTFTSEVHVGQFTSLSGVRSAEASGNRIRCEVIGIETELLQKAASLGAIEVRSEELGLDEIFLNLIENGGAK